MLALVAPTLGADAQWAATYAQAPLAAPHNGDFRARYAGADRLLNALGYADAARYETLWSDPAAQPRRIEQEEYARVTADLIGDPPRLASPLGMLAPSFARAVPEVVAMIDWAEAAARQAYDVLAAGGAEQDGRMRELAAYYRSRPDVAISARPKSVDALDAQFFSLSFRRVYPDFNGLTWASRWLELSLYEALAVSENADERRRMTDAAVARFRSVIQQPEQTPYLMPLTPVVAPAFAQRYPELAAALDNKHMLQDVLADIMVSREVPKSARRQEMLRAMSLFRSDTAFATAYESWLAMRTTIGAQNMGGPGVDLGAGRPLPTVARGMSLAGAVPRLVLATPAASRVDPMVGMQHGTTAPPAAGTQAGPDMPGMPGMPGMTQGQSTDVVMSVYQRMMRDPVIRERVATDPVIQRMLQGGAPAGGERAAPMDMPGTAAPAGEMTEERRLAVEFMVRLLSDSSVAGRIQSDPELRALWSDPDVQRRLAELRRQRADFPPKSSAPVRRPEPRPQPAPHNRH